MESIDVGKLRENFIVKSNDNNDNKFKSLIVAEVSALFLNISVARPTKREMEQTG